MRGDPYYDTHKLFMIKASFFSDLNSAAIYFFKLTVLVFGDFSPFLK